MAEQKLAMLVLSCDKYAPVWTDFFNLRDKFWADCPYKWYVSTESVDFVRENVEVIKCGKDLNWAGRFRKAVQSIDADYIGLFLEDYFISDKVDQNIVAALVELMAENNITTINTSDVFSWIINQRKKEYFREHLIIVPKHLRWGITTCSTIWEKQFLLDTIGSGDYSAWQFEIDRCKEAASETGLKGFNLCDDRMPFKVSTTPVIVQGGFYPPAIWKFKRLGYKIDTSQFPTMTFKQASVYAIKHYTAKIPFGKKFFKWVGNKVFGLKFFSDTL